MRRFLGISQNLGPIVLFAQFRDLWQTFFSALMLKYSIFDAILAYTKI